MRDGAAMAAPLHVLPYLRELPRIDGAPRAALAGHAVVGRITLGRDAWLGAGSLIRGDGHFVRIGGRLHLGRGSTVHIAHDRYPTLIGDRVAIGANAVIHACTIGDDCAIDDDCVILDGSTVQGGCAFEPGSVVFPRSELRGGFLYGGAPARPLRELQPGELQSRHERIVARNEAAAHDWSLGDAAQAAAPAFEPSVFVADTALVAGPVEADRSSSLWYGCRFDARAGPIWIGARANVQDNSVLVAGAGGIRIGAESTIGHNVELADCTVGSRSLVGMGSRIAAGTVIGDDCFVAGGARTLPGQQLDGGFLWGGNPARKLAPLDDGKRAIVRITADVYEGYARELQRAQAAQ